MLFRSYLKFAVRSSRRFFVMQIIGFATSQAGILLVAQFSKSTEIAQYAILMRILGIQISFVTFIFGSYQAELNWALGDESYVKLKRFFREVYLFSVVFMLIVFVSLFIFRNESWFLSLIGGVQIPISLIVSGLVFSLIWTINYPFSLAAISDFPTSWYFWLATIALPCNLMIAIVLLKYLNFLGAPLIANAISMVLFSILPFCFSFYRNRPRYF